MTVHTCIVGRNSTQFVGIFDHRKRTFYYDVHKRRERLPHHYFIMCDALTRDSLFSPGFRLMRHVLIWGGGGEAHACFQCCRCKLSRVLQFGEAGFGDDGGPGSPPRLLYCTVIYYTVLETGVKKGHGTTDEKMLGYNFDRLTNMMRDGQVPLYDNQVMMTFYFGGAVGKFDREQGQQVSS